VHNCGNEPEAIQLQSSHDKDGKFGAKATDTNRFWAGREDLPQGDSESETHVLGGHAGTIDITKMVDVLAVSEPQGTPFWMWIGAAIIV
jgi:hypothetical protein